MKEANKKFWNEVLDIDSFQFTMKYLKIHTNYTDPADDNEVLYNSKFNNGKPWEASAKLGLFARSHNTGKYNHGNFCLAHLFTFIDFVKGTIGLAYLGKARSKNSFGGSGAAGGNANSNLLAGSALGDNTGICASQYHHQESRYQNTAFTSWLNYDTRVTTAEAHLVTAHEIGHNLGAEHDCAYRQDKKSLKTCQASTKCTGNSNGDWLMSTFAVRGTKENNLRFSKCSAEQIKKASRDKVANCLKSETSATCGNFVQEEGEECDNGLNWFAADLTSGTSKTNKCCSSDCKFPNSSVKCSPMNHVCCNENCGIVSAAEQVICNNQEQCYEPIKCNGYDKNCPNLKKSEMIQKPLGSSCMTDKDEPGKCKNGQCQSLCQFQGKLDCLCPAGKNSCKICCQESKSSLCRPYYSDTGKIKYLTLGSECQRMTQVNLEKTEKSFGKCLQNPTHSNIKKDLKEIEDKIESKAVSNILEFNDQKILTSRLKSEPKLKCVENRGNGLVVDTYLDNLKAFVAKEGVYKLMADNIVMSVIFLSLLIWVPIAYICHAADMRQDEIRKRKDLAYANIATFAMMHPMGIIKAFDMVGDENYQMRKESLAQKTQNWDEKSLIYKDGVDFDKDLHHDFNDAESLKSDDCEKMKSPKIFRKNESEMIVLEGEDSDSDDGSGMTMSAYSKSQNMLDDDLVFDNNPASEIASMQKMIFPEPNSNSSMTASSSLPAQNTYKLKTQKKMSSTSSDKNVVILRKKKISTQSSSSDKPKVYRSKHRLNSSSSGEKNLTGLTMSKNLSEAGSHSLGAAGLNAHASTPGYAIKLVKPRLVKNSESNLNQLAPEQKLNSSKIVTEPIQVKKMDLDGAKNKNKVNQQQQARQKPTKCCSVSCELAPDGGKLKILPPESRQLAGHDSIYDMLDPDGAKKVK